MHRDLHGAVVAITGAASGIGRALALAAAQEGAKLALSDVNQTGLDETQNLCQAIGASATTMLVDVADVEQMQAWAQQIIADFGQVNVIVNNAGVNLNASAEASSFADFDWLMGINWQGVLNGSKVFLPHLKQASWGQVVNISSLFGMVGIPNQSAYNAAKFAVRGFTEALRMELKLERSSVSASCVHPGGIKTNIVNSAKYGERVGRQRSVDSLKRQFNNKLAKTTPEQAAAQIIRAIKRDQARVLVGLDAKLIDLLQRVLGSYYQKIVMAVS